MSNPCVILTPHFLDRLKERNNFPVTKFFSLIPIFAEAAKAHLNQECMFMVAATKVIFRGEDDRGTLILSFITVMPKEYKQNVFNKMKTVILGEITEWQEGKTNAVY